MSLLERYRLFKNIIKAFVNFGNIADVSLLERCPLFKNIIKAFVNFGNIADVSLRIREVSSFQEENTHMYMYIYG